jgi:hydroxyacylglutathione hydrolase
LESGHSLLEHIHLYKFYKDNIGYVIREPKTNSLIVIDAGHFETSRDVVEQLEDKYKAKFRYIFSTHGHWDHINGNQQWKDVRQDLEIVSGNCPDVEIPCATKKMNDLETMTIGDITFACMNVPGHTKEHVAFIVTHVTDNSTKIPFLFSGNYVG